jgi:hypothetical protein
MDIPRVLAGLVLYVTGATVIYALFFNAQFARDGELPMWLILTSVVMAIAALAILLWWLSRVAAGKVPEQQVRDYSGFLVIMVVTGVVSDLLGIAVEIVVGAPSVWMMIPISTITYCLTVLWIYRRYFRQQPR